MSLIKSKKRVADHGEVFTPRWLVEHMLDLVKGESERIDSRFLEPACGSGNFLIPVLQRKLAAVYLPSSASLILSEVITLIGGWTAPTGLRSWQTTSLSAARTCFKVFAEYLNLDKTDELYLAAFYVLSQNLVHGDALTMRMRDGQASITFAEWGYLGKGKFQRRDFRLEVLTQMSSFSQEGSLFAHLGKHEIFTPLKAHPPITARELACSPLEVGLAEAI